jgi:hypothetical protein
MRPDWRLLSLLLVLFGLWAVAALAPGCDGKPRPAELIPAQPGRGAYARSLARAEAAAGVRSGRLTLLEGAEAFRGIDRDNPDAPALDLDASCAEVIDWVRGADAENKVRPDLADLLAAELKEPKCNGLLIWPRR